jgi:hypothetical protein
MRSEDIFEDELSEEDREAAAIARAAELAAVRGLIRLRDGRKAVWRILERCGYRAQHQIAPIPLGDPVSTAHVVGELSVGSWLMAELMAADRELVSEMLEENAL